MYHHLMINKFKNVLVLAPHTDDGELGAGATISKLVELGSQITYVSFSTCAESVPKGYPNDVLDHEVRNATLTLGIKPENLIILDYKVRKFNYERQNILEDLIKIRSKKYYDLVLTPSLDDIHQDHSVIARESLRAFKNTSILGYELPWNNLSFETKCFIELNQDHINKKILSLKQYKSQENRNYLSEDIILSLAKTRGVQSGRDLAECFEVLKLYL